VSVDIEMLEMVVRHKNKPGFVTLSDRDILTVIERLRQVEGSLKELYDWGWGKEAPLAAIVSWRNAGELLGVVRP
jgi:hypothetical protein